MNFIRIGIVSFPDKFICLEGTAPPREGSSFLTKLPSSIGTTEPVTIEFKLKDVFGVTKTLKVVVKAAK